MQLPASESKNKKKKGKKGAKQAEETAEVDLDEVAKTLGPMIAGIPWSLIQEDSTFDYVKFMVSTINMAFT